MIPAVNQNCIAVVRLHNLLGVVFAAVQVLQGKACVLKFGNSKFRRGLLLRAGCGNRACAEDSSTNFLPAYTPRSP